MKTPNNPPLRTTPEKINVAVVGATGMVGREFISMLQERRFPVGDLRLFASERSSGEKVEFQSKTVQVSALAEGCFKGCQVAFFSAGADISKIWGPRAVEEGCFVIDNSSAFRMNPSVPLIVPEVNRHRIPTDLGKPELIANPNCSTIQLVVALKPIHDRFELKSVTVATYQSVSGAGKEAVEELKSQTSAFLMSKEEPKPSVFPHPIAFNNLPQIDKFDPDTGFTLEELKVINETKKIMELTDLSVSCTAVRTPTLNGHSEAVWVEIKKDIDRIDMMNALMGAPGVLVWDEPREGRYPLTREASGKDEVFVGRVRRDLSQPRRWLLWIVSDNIRKGAALNGIQIAEILFGLRTE